jgi:hypothetical protein
VKKTRHCITPAPAKPPPAQARGSGGLARTVAQARPHRHGEDHRRAEHDRADDAIPQHAPRLNGIATPANAAHLHHVPIDALTMPSHRPRSLRAKNENGLIRKDTGRKRRVRPHPALSPEAPENPAKRRACGDRDAAAKSDIPLIRDGPGARA